MGEPKPEVAMLHDMKVDPYLLECVQIDPILINEEFVRIPADLAYWNARYAQTIKRSLTAKMDLDKCITDGKKAVAEMEGLCLQDARKELGRSNPRVTESMVAAAVATDERLLAEREKWSAAEYRARQAYIDAEADKALIYGNVDAVRAKREMVVSLGAQIRKEMETDPSIGERARAHRGGELGGGGE